MEKDQKNQKDQRDQRDQKIRKTQKDRRCKPTYVEEICLTQVGNLAAFVDSCGNIVEDV